MNSYDKAEVREALTLDNIFELLESWGGEPEYNGSGIVAATICHNKPGEGSKKLYYYSSTDLFHCFTGCQESFDIFQLAMKVSVIQQDREIDLNDAVRMIAHRFGIITSTVEQEDDDKLEDWSIFDRYKRVQSIELKDYSVELKEYDTDVLDRLNYKVKLAPWLREGISQDAIESAHIGYYPGRNQITIPHYDMNGRFIGLRGRTLSTEEAEQYGKYRPVVINQLMYTHSLGMNLYNLNKSKDNIKKFGKAIIFESEKSCLQYRTCFGADADISVACCGSNVTLYQMHQLFELGVKEVIIAFDRDFEKIGDDTFKKMTANLTKIHKRFKNYATISFIFDKKMITKHKSSPIDESAEKFLQLYKERIIL